MWEALKKLLLHAIIAKRGRRMLFPIATKETAHCTDCYRCLRKCSIDAIRFSTGKAQIIQPKCVLCGECIEECPQKTKYIISDFKEVKRLLDEGEPLVLSVGETVINHFPKQHPYDVLCEAIDAGFLFVEQVDIVEESLLEIISDYLENREGLVISSHCAVVVNLVEQHYPHLLPSLMKIPTIASLHAQSLKKRFPQAKVVHVTSCVAELNNMRTREDVDYLIMFNELEKLLAENNNEFALCDKDLDIEDHCGGYAFSISGNIVKKMLTSGVEDEGTTESFSGIKACIDILENIEDVENAKIGFLELMACPSGCVNGQELKKKGSVMDRCIRMAQYETERRDYPKFNIEKPEQIADFHERGYIAPKVDQIDVMEEMQFFFGKKDMRALNCAACGYDSCYKKSEAVIRGEANRMMCMSYMRRNAESFAENIVFSSLNGLIVFKDNFEIIQLNPRIKTMLSGYKIKEGTKLSSYMNTDFMRQVIDDGIPVEHHDMYLEVTDSYVEIRVMQLEDLENTYLAIFSDVTEHEKRKKELAQVKKELLLKAEKVIDEQMHTAQQIANLLGETTAATKITLLDLIHAHEE